MQIQRLPSIVQRNAPHCTLLLQHYSQIMCVTIVVVVFYHITINHNRTYKSHSSQGDTLDICGRLLTQITAPHFHPRPPIRRQVAVTRRRALSIARSRALLHFIEFIIEHNIYGLWLTCINAKEMYVSQIIYSKVNCF